MKVLHLATRDQGGGGFNAAHRLHCMMRNAGADSVMLVLNKQSDDPYVIAMSDRLSFLERLRWYGGKAIQRYNQRYRAQRYFHVEGRSPITAGNLLATLPFKPDAILIHWVSSFLTSELMRQLSVMTGAPLYWYMMDMAAMTGGCHYAFDCRGYIKQCGNCPQLRYGRSQHDVSYRQWHRKFSNLHGTDITAVVGSSWLKRQAEESSMFSGRPIKEIMLGMDADVFKPAPQHKVRAILGLPVDRKIIFFGAQSVHEERKGFKYLIDAFNLLGDMLNDNPDLHKNVLVVTAGFLDGTQKLEIPFEHQHLGSLQGDAALAAAYQAADVFVNASIEDSGPMMINESILCGTPVVSFDMGVAPDLVHTSRTGYRAQLRDSHDMARGLRILLEMKCETFDAMRRECRELGLRFCNADVQVQSFFDLFSSHPSLQRPGNHAGACLIG